MTSSSYLMPVKRHAQSGLSLVELMISIVVGLLLMVIILQIFLGSKNTYRVTENHSRMQENGRYILQEMSSDIRMAGYLGCAKNAKVNMMVSGAAGSWAKYIDAVHGYEAASESMGLKDAEVLAGTDIIRIQRASGADGNLAGNLAADNANIKIGSNPDGFADGDTLIVSDCASADVFCANSVSNGKGETTITHSEACNDGTAPKLSKLYGSYAQVMRLITHIYYVGTGSDGCAANMLCRKNLNGANLVVEQLIDNVENMQLEYGEDTDGDATANRFVSAPSVGDWNNVVSVRLKLSLQSNDMNLSSSSKPADRRMRREYSSTVTLRNRTM